MSQPKPNPLSPEALKVIGATPDRVAQVVPTLRPGVTVSPEDFVRGGKPLDLAKADTFYRLTTPTGPAALEELRVLDGKVVSRRVVEPKNVRAVVLERLVSLNDGSGSP